VGQALRRNPFAPEVPCHRVIAADLTIGGFAGRRQGREIVRKQALLAAEGVRFTRAGRLAEPERLYRFDASKSPFRNQEEERASRSRVTSSA
jgi:methylated-DNA-[protein]-cysteine S-methyltransferase